MIGTPHSDTEHFSIWLEFTVTVLTVVCELIAVIIFICNKNIIDWTRANIKSICTVLILLHGSNVLQYTGTYQYVVSTNISPLITTCIHYNTGIQCIFVWLPSVLQMGYTMPHWFSIDPNTLFIAATPLSGYSDIDTISVIYSFMHTYSGSHCKVRSGGVQWTGKVKTIFNIIQKSSNDFVNGKTSQSCYKRNKQLIR